jgi:hypothetical protein
MCDIITTMKHCRDKRFPQRQRAECHRKSLRHTGRQTPASNTTLTLLCGEFTVDCVWNIVLFNAVGEINHAFSDKKTKNTNDIFAFLPKLLQSVLICTSNIV